MRTPNTHLQRIATVVAAVWLALGAAPEARAQQGGTTDVSKRGTSAAAFLELGVGTRATAMGGAFVATADDPSALYWNPAGVAALGRSSFIAERTNWVADMKLNYAGGTVDLGNLGTLGLSLTHMEMISEEPVRTIEQPEGTGELFGASSFALGVTYAKSLTDRFSFGVTPKFIREGIWDMSANAFAVDLGILYTTPFDGLRLGASISNFGTELRMGGDNTLVLHDPEPGTGGNNNNIAADQRTEGWDLPLLFRVGVAYPLLNTATNRLTVAVDADVPSNNYQSVNVGAEYVFMNAFSLQGGYRSLFLDGSEQSFTLGFGVQQAFLGNLLVQAGFSYADIGRLGNSTKLALALSF